MRLLAADARDDEVIALCREWVELVAQGRLDEAIGILWTAPAYDRSQLWTAATLREYIANYGSWEPRPDGRTWRITSAATARLPDDAPGRVPRADLVRLEADPRCGSVELDVPLDGEWSDLTAQFEFQPVDGGVAVSLYDLHVL